MKISFDLYANFEFDMNRALALYTKSPVRSDDYSLSMNTYERYGNYCINIMGTVDHKLHSDLISFLEDNTVEDMDNL